MKDLLHENLLNKELSFQKQAQPECNLDEANSLAGEIETLSALLRSTKQTRSDQMITFLQKQADDLKESQLNMQEQTSELQKSGKLQLQQIDQLKSELRDAQEKISRYEIVAKQNAADLKQRDSHISELEQKLKQSLADSEER